MIELFKFWKVEKLLVAESFVNVQIMNNFTNINHYHRMSEFIPEVEAPKPRKFIKQPDNVQKNKIINQLNDEVKKIEASIENVSKQIELTSVTKEDSAKRQELSAELRQVINSQNDTRKQRNYINDQIKMIDQSIKKKVGEITAKTAKHNFRNTDDIDRRIRSLESEVESGSLMLVEEKKALKEITSLNKLKKDFAGISQVQASIDSDKEKITELKSKLSGFNNKEIQGKFEEITKELEAINQKNGSVQKKRDELYAKKKELVNTKYETIKEIKEIRVQFDKKFKKFQEEVASERKKREEEEKAYNLSLERNDILEQIEELESSAQFVSTDSIELIKGAIRTLKPDFKFEEESTVDAIDALFEKVDITNNAIPENLEIIKKTEESFIVGTGGKSKKMKKSKKQNKAVEKSVNTTLALLNVAPPANADEVDSTVEVLVAKLEEEKKAIEAAKEKKLAVVNKQIAELKEQASGLGKQILEELARESERKAAKKAAAAEEAETTEEVKEETVEEETTEEN